LEQIKPRKIFDVTPYGVAKTETFQAVPENPFQATGKLSKLNGGIDAKIGVTNNMTMDLTINPDFGQVEADPSVVNLSAYETFLLRSVHSLLKEIISQTLVWVLAMVGSEMIIFSIPEE